MARSRSRCWFCGDYIPPGKATADHLTPKSMGGRTHRHNLVTACLECNRRKGARTLEHYRQQYNHGALFWGEARGRKQ